MKLIKKNTSDLAIGDFFLASENSYGYYCVLAQGPTCCAYAVCDDNGKPLDTCLYGMHHKDVLVEAPRSTVGEFKVGERFRTGGISFGIWTVTAVGQSSSLATRGGEESQFFHRELATEAPEEQK